MHERSAHQCLRTLMYNLLTVFLSESGSKFLFKTRHKIHNLNCFIDKTFNWQNRFLYS